MIAYPPTIDIDSAVTQIEHNIMYDIYSSSSSLKKTYHFLDNNISTVNKLAIFSTGIFLETPNDVNNSTWEEFIGDNFDVVSNVFFKRSFKLKSRIKKVTKYSPKIIID